MKKWYAIVVMLLMITLSACTTTVDVVCGEGTTKIEGKCEIDTETCDYGFVKEEGVCVKIDEPLTCNEGFHEVDGQCVLEELTCDVGYHEEDGQCVLDAPIDFPDWFAGWALLTEPVGNKTLSDLTFTEDGFSIFLSGDSRVGIQMANLVLEPGYYYEVAFDYSSDVAGKILFVQLQGHGGFHLTNPEVMTNESTQSFSQILSFPETFGGTDNGWLTVELMPSIAGTVTIENIELIKTALPVCGENEVIKGIVCVADNNGYLPNGTPTDWFTGWEILNGPIGNKEISDYHFSETGFTAYLDAGQRTGIQLMDYVFESGYTYELSFEYTALEPGRMIWVQMEALGGYGFTNTDTWTISGTQTFTQTLTVPNTYTPVEPGWIKIELTPSGVDNITIENIVITKTPIT